MNYNYEEVSGGSKTDRAWPAKNQVLKEGDFIEGLLVEKNANVGPNNSMMYVLEVGEEKVGVWGSAVIDTKMAKVAVGKMVKIEFKGMEEGKGGRTYKDFRVYQGIAK